MPKTIFCPTCNFGYVYGLKGEAHRHAAYHMSYMWQRRPRSEPRLAAFGSDVRVDAESPQWLQRIVYRCAVGLQRDEHYDFPQWRPNGPPRMEPFERDLHALALVENGSIAVGAVGFAWTKWSDSEPGWLMLFAWVADEWRRRGVMTHRWPEWRKTYGAFELQPPLSRAMRSFVAKMREAAIENQQ